MRIVSVGECTIDHYGDLHQQHIGGISLNFAVNAKRSGAEFVSLVSRIGDDKGARILQRLSKEKIDASHVSMVPGTTATQEIVLGSDGERVFPSGGYKPGVLEGFRLSESDLQFIQSHDVLASALFKQVEPLFRQAIAGFEGWRVADFLDLSDYEYDLGVIEIYSERLQIAFVSGNPGMAESLRALSRDTSCLIVVTLGPEGSVVLVKGEPVHQPPLKVQEVVDSTGCGDAFQAAFTVSYVRDRDVRRALDAGAQRAARVLQHMGAIG